MDCTLNKNNDITELLNSFRETALSYGEAMEIGDHRSANKSSRHCDALKHQITGRGTEAIKLLLKLLDDEEPWIRYATAASALDIQPERAYQKLMELQQHKGAVGASAFASLRMHDSGSPKT
jgi:hypothetical protein